MYHPHGRPRPQPAEAGSHASNSSQPVPHAESPVHWLHHPTLLLTEPSQPGQDPIYRRGKCGASGMLLSCFCFFVALSCPNEMRVLGKGLLALTVPFQVAEQGSCHRKTDPLTSHSSDVPKEPS